jgi:hypothetical protein
MPELRDMYKTERPEIAIADGRARASTPLIKDNSVYFHEALGHRTLRVIVSKFVESEAEAAARRSVFRRALRELPTEGGGEMRCVSESAG